MIRNLLLILLILITPLITNNTYASDNEPVVKRVRIDFTSPDGFVRHLLLSFIEDNTATDGFDYGYDARNWDNFANDLNWMIEDERYVIQGVGEFKNHTNYPLGLFLADSGDIKIELTALENFDEEIPVFIRDNETGEIINLQDVSLQKYVENGDYLNRFSILFNSDVTLSDDEEITDDILKLNYEHSTEIFTLRSSESNKLNGITIYNIEGKMLINRQALASADFSINANNIRNIPLIVSVSMEKGTIHKTILLN